MYRSSGDGAERLVHAAAEIAITPAGPSLAVWYSLACNVDGFSFDTLWGW